MIMYLKLSKLGVEIFQNFAEISENFNCENFNAHLYLGVDFESRLEGLGSGRFHLGSESNFIGVVCFYPSRFLTLCYDCFFFAN